VVIPPRKILAEGKTKSTNYQQPNLINALLPQSMFPSEVPPIQQ